MAMRTAGIELGLTPSDLELLAGNPSFNLSYGELFAVAGRPLGFVVPLEDLSRQANGGHAVPTPS